MSQFRKLVEEIINQYKLLTPQLQDGLIAFLEGLDIEVSELSSAVWNSNPYDVEPQLAGGSGTYDYDENEYRAAQIKKAIEYIEADGAIEYLWNLIPKEIKALDKEDPQKLDAYSEVLDKEALDFLNKELAKYER